MVDEKIKFKDLGGPISPEQARARLVEKRKEMVRKAQKAFFTDFTSVTFGDYINAVHAYNRSSMGASVDPTTKSAYFTFFAYDESCRRLEAHFDYIN